MSAGGPFAPFGNAQFSLFSVALLVSSTAIAIQSMGRVWLIQDTTHSPLLVSAVSAAGGLPILILGFYGGYLADRFSRKWISVVGEIISFLIAAGLAALAFAGVAETWHVITASALQGVTTALVVSARQTMITDLAAPERHRSAIGLSMLVANLSGITGPAVAGALIPSFGTDWALIVGAAVALSGVALFWLIKTDQNAAPARRGGKMTRELADGVRYVARTSTLRWLMLGAMIMLVMVSSRGAVFPPLVQDVLGRGAGALGVMEMVGGVGAVLGPLMAVALSKRYSDVKVETVSGFAFAGVVAALAVSPWFELTVFLSGMATFVGTVFFATNLSAIQLGAPLDLRGRVISVRFALSGSHPAGLMALGALAQAFGPREALFAFSLAAIGLFALLNFALPARATSETPA